MIEKGFILMPREILESELFLEKKAMWFKIWFFLVTRANHKSNKYYKRGGNWTSYGMIIDQTGATRGQIDHCLRYLKKINWLKTWKSTRGFKFEIIDYEYYQTAANYERDIGEKRTRFTSDTINKNDKNDKNDKYPSKVVKENRYDKYLYGVWQGDTKVFRFDDGQGLKVIAADGTPMSFGGDINEIVKV